ncbi:MAG: cofactor-independent phosphoglycerate mutase [Nitrospirota bacterium]
MKYIVLVGDGMADRPLEELGGKTCLQAADTPNMDKLASSGQVGMVRTIPEELHPGSDVANLSILGYNPLIYYTGRAPLEAASLRVDLSSQDVAYRCNLVTLTIKDNGAIMEDYSAGHISSEEARLLIEDIDKQLGNDNLRFYAGIGYRHIMVWKNGKEDVECVPPHDITGKPVVDYLPVGDGSDVLRRIMADSSVVLKMHPVNIERRENKRREANGVWLWGQGRVPQLPAFIKKYGLKGGIISAVDLTKGIGIYAGFKIIDVPGATGYLDTNYEGKADYAVEALNNLDFVYLHVESPDEAGHNGDIDAKIRAIEDFDHRVVRKVTEDMEQFPEYRILLLTDHPTPIGVRTHTREPVPFVIYDSRGSKVEGRRSRVEGRGSGIKYDEAINEIDSILRFEEGYRLMDYFIKGK